MRLSRFGAGLVWASAAPMILSAPSANETPEALRDAVRKAFEARSVDAWIANIGGAPLGEADRIVLEGTLKRIFEASPVFESAELVDLPDELEPLLVAGGRKYMMTLTPEGAILLKFRIGKRSTEIALPYGRFEGGYKLATLRGENLNWRGPEDREYTLDIRHSGEPSDIGVVVHYNASGVDLVKRVRGKVTKLVLPAQYIERVELERTGGKGVTSFEISCIGTGDANARVKVFTSENLHRAGSLKFEIKRKPGANEPGR